MRLLIDSNRFIDFCAGDEAVIQVMESAALLFIPFVVLAEIRDGSLVIKRGQNQVRVLQQLLNAKGVRSVHSIDSTTHHYASLYSQLKKAGTPIPTNDIWIAALAIEHDLILYTRDAHFKKISSLARLG